MGIPWAIIIETVLRILNFFIKDKDRKDALKRQMFEFIKKHDESALGNVRLRDEYDELLARAAADKKKRDDESQPSH